MKPPLDASSPDPTSRRSGLDRRRFLQTLLLAWAGSPLLTWRNAFTATATEPGTPPAWLTRVTGQREAVVRLGQAYLSGAGTEQDPQRLLQAIDQSLTGLPAGRQFSDDPHALAMALQQAVRADYVGDRTLDLQDWVLSQTEVRLYALVALLA